MMRSRLVLVLLILAAAAAAPQPGARLGAQSAPAVDAPHLELLRWRSIGPSRGGRVLAVSGDPVNRFTFYQGTTGGGVWKTDDGGHQLGERVRRLTSRPARSAPSRWRRRIPNVDLRRHGRGVLPRQRLARRRRLQVHRRRQDVDAHRARGHAADRAPADSSDQPRHRLRGGARATRGGRVPTAACYRTRDGGRTWQKVLYRERQRRRHRHRARSRPTPTSSTPRRSSCGAIRGASAAPGPARRSTSPPTAATPGRT